MNAEIVVTPLAEPITDLTCTWLRSKFRHEIASGRLRHVVDLSELSEMDTKTLSELIRMRRWVREVGGFVHLIVQAPNVLEILAIAGLDRLFAVFATRRAAFAAIAPAKAS